MGLKNFMNLTKVKQPSRDFFSGLVTEKWRCGKNTFSHPVTNKDLNKDFNKTCGGISSVMKKALERIK